MITIAFDVDTIDDSDEDQPFLSEWPCNRKTMTNVHFDGEEIYQGVISADIESLVKLMTHF